MVKKICRDVDLIPHGGYDGLIESEKKPDRLREPGFVKEAVLRDGLPLYINITEHFETRLSTHFMHSVIL